MSNLYKQKNVVSHAANKRVINSNEIVAEKMEELAQKASAAKASGAEHNSFVAGLKLESVDVVLKEEEVSPEEAYQELEAKAAELIKRAKIKAESIDAQAVLQAEKLKQQAKDSGYADGFSAGKADAKAELEIMRQDLEAKQAVWLENYSQKLEELEPQLVKVISDIFEKVFHVQFDDKKEILLYLIQNTILGIEGTKDFLVRVGSDDYRFLEEHKNEIEKHVGKAVNMEIMADSTITDGQCVIETDSGVFDCGRDIQLENLIKALQSLSL